jgi:hypothetical protein
VWKGLWACCQKSVKESRIHFDTDLAKADMRAHVSSHALTEFPPGVLQKKYKLHH